VNWASAVGSIWRAMGKGQQNKKNDKKKVEVEDTLEPILREFREEYNSETTGAQCKSYPHNFENLKLL
jgi:hypothetical protein